ncbi:MAG: cation transporter [Clostridiales bacterium]|nr:cation transporter [Clostridiales bacterium]
MTNLLIKIFMKNRNENELKTRERYGKFASIVGICTNILLFIIKFTVGIAFNSISITADAINNLSDSGTSLVTFVGFKLSGKPADSQHPYGHARMEYIAGLIVSFIILFLGLQTGKASIEKIIHPQEASFSIVAVVMLIISILIKGWQFLFYRKIGRTIDSITLLATSVDSRNDIYSTFAVLVSVIITRLTGFNLDGYMGLVVAFLIIITAIGLIKDTINPLLGNAPSKELVDSIYEKILSYNGIIGLHDLIVHNYGAAQYFASVHCEVCAEQDVMVSHDIIDNIERDFLKDYNIHLVIHMDPIVRNDEKTNALKAKVIDIINSISEKISIHDFRVVWGITHSNLIFDVVVPFNFYLSDRELVEHISEKILEIDESYNSIITIDHE